MSAWNELLEAAREFHKERPHACRPCRLGAALAAFPEVPSLFDAPIDDPPEFDPDLLEKDTVGGFRASDPDTSRKAAVFNYPRSGSQRHKAFVAIWRAGGRGATASELIEALGIPHQSVSTRLSELKHGGWIAPSGEERQSTLGADQEVLVATQRGTEEALARELVPA